MWFVSLSLSLSIFFTTEVAGRIGKIKAEAAREVRLQIESTEGD